MKLPDPTQKPTAAEPGTVQVRLGVLAVAALLVTVAALTTLVIVVAIREADLLSVVALALAIIAFSAQLIIYVVQTADSASSSRRSLALHVELSALLSELRERTGSTQKSVDSINSRLLEAVIGKTESLPSHGSPRDFAERVAETYAEVSRGSSMESATSGVPRSSVGISYPEPLPVQDARALHAYMSEWPPEEESAEIEEKLRSMSFFERASLQGFASDFHRSTRPGSSFAPGLQATGISDAVENLVEKVKGWNLWVLNREGRRLGRVFTAQGEPPIWARSLSQLRDEVLEESRRIMDNRDSQD